MRQDRGSDCPSRRPDALKRYRSQVLALTSRGDAQPIRLIGLNGDFRLKRSKRCSEGDDVKHGRLHVKDLLTGDNHRRMRETRFWTLRQPEVEIDDITRVRHRATLIRLGRAEPGDLLRFGPD